MAKKSKTKTRKVKAKAKKSADGARIAKAIGRFPDDAVIKMLKKGNQRRPGSRAAKRYAIYRDGITVGEFVKKGRKAGLDTSKSNVKKDVQRGNIKLVFPKAKGGLAAPPSRRV